MLAARKERFKRLRGFISAAFTCALLLPALLLPSTVSAAADTRVKYRLKVSEGVDDAIDVMLRFKLDEGKSVELTPSASDSEIDVGQAAATYELLSSPVPQYMVEPLEQSSGGWTVTAVDGGEIELSYRVKLAAATGEEVPSDATTALSTAVDMVGKDLVLVAGSTAFLCPRDARSGSHVAGEYYVEVDTAEGEEVLVPFEKDVDSFSVNSTSELLDNYVCWGRLALSEDKVGETVMGTGLAGAYRKLSEDDGKRYTEGLAGLMAAAVDVLGERPRLERLSLLVEGVEEAGLDGPASSTMLGSVALFQDREKLEGEASVIASRGLFDLWNEWSMVPTADGDAFWFQAGLPGIYGDRLAVAAGLTDSDSAYKRFSQVYADYLADSRSKSISLVEAHDQGDEEFVARKSTVLCAAVDSRLQEQTGGQKDIDWLVGQIAQKHDHFKGRDYTMVDIEELCENATGESWSRFFDEGIRGTSIIDASEFSSTKLFSASSALGRELTERGSGKGWILLIVAVVVILLIPLVFSTYIRRSVKLDLTMPKILPDDEDDDEV